MSNNCGKCSTCTFFGTFKTDDGRTKYCTNSKIMDLFNTDTVDYDFGCIWHDEEDKEINIIE